MSDPTQQAGQDLRRAGMALMVKSFQQAPDNKEEVARANALGAYITGEIIPFKASGKMSVEEAMQRVRKRGGDLGFDPNFSIGMLSKQLQVKEQYGAKAGDPFKAAERLQKLEKGELDIQRTGQIVKEADRPAAEKAVEKVSAERVLDTKTSLEGIQEVVRGREDVRGDAGRHLEKLVDDFADAYPEAGLEGFLGRNLPKSIGELAQVLSRQLRKLPEFQPYDEEELAEALSVIFSDPGADITTALRRLTQSRPASLGGDLGREALLRRVQPANKG